MPDFFEIEQAARETLESERAEILAQHAKQVSDLDTARDKALAAAQDKFDKAQLKAAQDHAAARAAARDAIVAAVNAEAGLDKDGNVPKKQKKTKA
mgnify:FL=1